MYSSGTRAGKEWQGQRTRDRRGQGQDGQGMKLVRNGSYYYYTIREGVKSRGIWKLHGSGAPLYHAKPTHSSIEELSQREK